MDDWEDFPSMPFRDRSNTWPRCVQIRPGGSPPPSVPDIIEEPSEVETVHIPSVRRIKPRRNVWGNKSYSELITEAILSTDKKRMMLAEIYNWMVKNVDCFSDKHADNSSAGWKNSIRHNLSLHDCFMKLPNEQASKSHWWVLNPNARSSKMQRRRISSHYNSTMDLTLEQPEEPFRRRTKSDCSSLKRPLPPSSSRYSPNCSRSSYTSDFEKEEANIILDSLIKAMKLEADVNFGSVSGEEHTETSASPLCNTERCIQETNDLVSSVTEALMIEREDNRYLEAVEPVSASSSTFSDLSFVSSSAPGYSADALSPYPVNSIRPSQTQHSTNSEESHRSNMHCSSWDSQQQTSPNNSFLTARKSKAQQWHPPINFDNLKDEEMFQALGKENQFEFKEPNGACNWSDDSNVDFTSAQRLPTLKQLKNEDSLGRPRSKSYSGFIPKREISDSRSYEVTSNVTPRKNSFDLALEELIRENYGELTFQDVDLWPVIDEWQSSTMLSTALNS